MASLTPPPAKALPFNDARGCKEWLNALPLTNIPQAQALALDALRALNAAELDALERLKCLELMRDKIAFLQGEQRSRYFGKTLPLSVNDSNAWTTGRTLLEEMESGYRLCLAAAAEGGEIARLTGLVTQRIVRYIGTQMLFHAMVYRRFDPQLWTRLHQQYLEAEATSVSMERVKDSLETIKKATADKSACTTRLPSFSWRISLRSSIDTTSKRPSGSQPKPDGCPGTVAIFSTLPSIPTAMTWWV